MLSPVRLRVLGALIVSAVCAVCAVLSGGCAGKPGTSVNVQDAPPVSFQDPSSTQSAHVLTETATTVTGPLGSETAKFTNDQLLETNSGSALKQRGAVTFGDVRGMLSGASDLDIQGVEATFTDGKVSTLKIAKLGTSNSAVQRAVNEGVGLLVAQWQRSSDNERAVLEKQIEAQAAIGDAVATTALSVVKLLKGVP